MRDIYRCITLDTREDATAPGKNNCRLKATVMPAIKVLVVFMLASALWLEGGCRIVAYLLGPQADHSVQSAIEIAGYGVITAALLFVAVMNIACELHQARMKIQESEYELILRLGQASEWRDDESGEHTVRVGEYTATLARTLGWNVEDCRRIEVAAMLHDIGKIGIPDFVMVNHGELNDEERELIHAHTLMGSDILANSEILQVQIAQRIAASHHERWDGTGYPYGLKGKEIPIEGRLVAVADVFDALTSRRRYKPAWKFDVAAEEIIKLSGTHFDPKVVAAFNKALPQIRAIYDKYSGNPKGPGINRAA